MARIYPFPGKAAAEAAVSSRIRRGNTLSATPDRYRLCGFVAQQALKALSEEGKVPAAKVAEAIAKYNIQADKVNPLYA